MGPLSVLFAGFTVGRAILCLGFLCTILSSRTHNDMVELVNLMKEHKPEAVSKRERFLAGCKASFFPFINIIVSVSYMLSSGPGGDLETQLQNRYYLYVELDENKATQVLRHASGGEELEYFPLWKRVIGFLIVLSEMDRVTVMLGSSLVYFILSAKTMDSVVEHFVISIRDTQRFCVVSCDEV